jgi:hypothetical protein
MRLCGFHAVAFHRFLAEGGPERRCLTSQVWCERDAPTTSSSKTSRSLSQLPLPADARPIDDPLTWRARQELYPPRPGRRI